MKRGFHWLSQAWHAKPNLANSKYKDEIHIGLYEEGGGTGGEFSVQWFELGGKLCPRIALYSDSWKLFKEFSDLFEYLPKFNEKDPSPLEFAAALDCLGFEDMTIRKSPYDKPEKRMTPLNQYYSVIHHWNEIIDMTVKIVNDDIDVGFRQIKGIDYDADGCSYCVVGLDCDEGCPVYKITKTGGCRGTPWMAFDSAVESLNWPEARTHAIRMRDFLLRTKPTGDNNA